MEKKSQASRRKHWMRNPWTTFAGMILGGVVGIYFQGLGIWLGSLGKLYMALLGMGVLPTILTAIVSGIGRMLKTGRSGLYLKRLLAVFSAGVLLASGVGLLAGILGRPGLDLSDRTQAALGNIFLRAEIYTSAQKHGFSTGFIEFLEKLVPGNFFSSLSQGQTLSVVLVSVLLGVAVGLSQKKSSQIVLDSLDVYYDAFLRIIGWVLFALPAGIFCFTAGQVAVVGPEIFIALAKFIVIFYLACYVMCFLYSLAIWRATDLTLVQSLARLKEPLIMAFGTRSSIATIPVAMRCLREDLKLDREVVDMVVPLGVVLNKHSFPLCFSLAAVFISQLYLVPLGIGDYVVILFVSALAGMAASGPPVVVASMLAFVLGPLGLPADAGVMMFVAAGPILEPIITVLNIHAPCAAAALIDRPATVKRFEEETASGAGELRVELG